MGYIGFKEFRLHLFLPLYPLYYIVRAMRTTENIVFKFFHTLFYIDISYQLLNGHLSPPAPYSSLETNLMWETLIRRSYLLSLVT